ALLEIDPQLAALDDRLGRSVGPPQRSAQTSEQLLDPERLRHVVVGAGVERGNLLGLVADHGQDDHRSATPGAQLTADRGAAAVREDEIEHDGVGRIRGERGERGLGRLGSLDLVSRTPEAGPQGAQDLRLVVDDEDALAAHARTGARRSASGRERTRWPPAGSSCAQSRPPFASAKPRAIASPRPEPCPAAPRRKGRNSASRCSSGRPAPESTTWMRSSVAPGSGRRSTREPGGEYLSALSSRFASTRSTWAASTSTGGVSEPISSRTRAASAPRPASARPTSSSTCQSPRCGPA